MKVLKLKLHLSLYLEEEMRPKEEIVVETFNSLKGNFLLYNIRFLRRSASIFYGERVEQRRC